MIAVPQSARRPPAPQPISDSAKLLRELGRVGEAVLVFRCGFFNLWRRCRLRGFEPVANSRKWRDEGCGISLDPEALRGGARRGGDGSLRCELHLRSAGSDVGIRIREMEDARGFAAARDAEAEPAWLASGAGDGIGHAVWLDESLDGAAPDRGAGNPSASWFSIDLGEGGEVERVRFGSGVLDLDVAAKLRVVDRDGPILRLADAGASTVLYLPESEHGLGAWPASLRSGSGPEPSSAVPARRSLFETLVRHPVSA